MSKVTVLIADDLKFFLEIEKTYLMRGGFEVITAESGQQAVEIAAGRRPHLILLDLEMPKMDGIQACAALRKNPDLKDTPIIIMSARGDKATHDRCVQAGCTEFLVKPEKPDELLGLVARILRVRRRVSERITVVFDVQGDHAGRQIVGRATDLSISGMCLETNVSLPANAILEMEFYLPKTHYQVRLNGTVTRSEPNPEGGFRTGVQFSDLSQADQEQILEYVSV